MIPSDLGYLSRGTGSKLTMQLQGGRTVLLTAKSGKKEIARDPEEKLQGCSQLEGL